jgi:hypothetical protein
MNPNLPPLEAVRAQVTDWLLLSRSIPAGALIDSATPAVVALRAIRDDAGIIVTTLHEGLTDAEAERDALRARAEAAEAALATARAEGAAAERAAVVAFLHGGADTHAGIGSPAAAAVLRNHAAYIAIGEHVRPVESA